MSPRPAFPTGVVRRYRWRWVQSRGDPLFDGHDRQRLNPRRGRRAGALAGSTAGAGKWRLRPDAQTSFGDEISGSRQQAHFRQIAPAQPSTDDFLPVLERGIRFLPLGFRDFVSVHVVVHGDPPFEQNASVQGRALFERTLFPAVLKAIRKGLEDTAPRQPDTRYHFNEMLGAFIGRAVERLSLPAAFRSARDCVDGIHSRQGRKSPP